MSRDHYKGVPKTRDAVIDGDGNLQPLSKGGGVPAISLFGLGQQNANAITIRTNGAVVHVYVDPVAGSDSNDGLSASAPLKNLVALETKFPREVTNDGTVVVHLLNDTSSVVEIEAPSVHLGGGYANYVNNFVYRGPDMILSSLATGPSTAALDSTPAVRVGQDGNASGTGVRTRLDFTTASPGWTVNDMAGHFLRVTRAGSRVFDELPIVENTADTIFVDTLDIVGTILNTDTVEIVEPAVKLKGSAANYGVMVVTGAGTPQANSVADTVGAAFERVSFQDVFSWGTWGLQFDRCRLGDGGIVGAGFIGGSVSFRNTVAPENDLHLQCASGAALAGRSDDAPIDADAAVALAVLDAELFVGGSTFDVPRNPAMLVFYKPVACYRSPGHGMRVYGNGTEIIFSDFGGNLTGTGHAQSGVFCKNGARVRVQSSQDKTTISGSAGALRLGTGATINYGTGSGQFHEVAGWNGHFTRVLEGTATAPTGDTSVITTKSIY
jgi:hypothetical protein